MKREDADLDVAYSNKALAGFDVMNTEVSFFLSFLFFFFCILFLGRTCHHWLIFGFHFGIINMLPVTSLNNYLSSF